MSIFKDPQYTRLEKRTDLWWLEKREIYKESFNFNNCKIGRTIQLIYLLFMNINMNTLRQGNTFNCVLNLLKEASKMNSPRRYDLCVMLLRNCFPNAFFRFSHVTKAKKIARKY